jgi:subtilisin family serine protease
MKQGGSPQQYNGGNNPVDEVGHGTHVAGIIGALHNKIGIAGINASVQLMPLKFIGGDGSGPLDEAVMAIAYAVQHGADVINASWGATDSSELLAEAVKYAIDNGVLFVAAAGNDGMDNDQSGSFPANYPGVMSVAASDDTDRVANFSNFGRLSTHIAAPGVSVLSTFHPFFIFNNQYEWLSGTSMAAPQVTGVAAMLIGMYPEKFKKNPDALMQRLMDSSDVQPGLLPRTVSGGRLNAYNAVAGIVTPGHYPVETLSWDLKVPVSIESSHPYTDDTSQEWLISQPGAKWIRLDFGRYSMEMINDYVEIRDGNDRLIDVLTGFGTSATSRPVQGDTVHVKFISNGHVTGWGFELKGYEVSQ